mgnify:CR=1 FL=1
MKVLRNPIVLFLTLFFMLFGGIILYKEFIVDAGPEDALTGGSDQVVPDFVVIDADGREVKLSDFRGEPIILSFFASWHGQCITELPAFESTFKERGAEAQFMMVDIVGNGRETLESGQAFIERSGYTFPVFYDVNQDAAKKYRVRAVPVTFFIDAEGALLAVGEGRIDEETLNQGLDIITGKAEADLEK